MKFIDIYNRIINLWPETIDISDGYPVGNDGFNFPSFNKIYDNIEDTIDVEKDHWGNLAVWAFSQAFHQTAKEIKTGGGDTLRTRDVSKQLIDQTIRMNLEPTKWGDLCADLRNEYEGLA